MKPQIAAWQCISNNPWVWFSGPSCYCCCYETNNPSIQNTISVLEFSSSSNWNNGLQTPPDKPCGIGSRAPSASRADSNDFLYTSLNVFPQWGNRMYILIFSYISHLTLTAQQQQYWQTPTEQRSTVQGGVFERTDRPRQTNWQAGR